jgi:hypothetical protein
MKLSKKIMAIALSTTIVGGAFAAQYQFERKAPHKTSYAQGHKPTFKRQKAVELQLAPIPTAETSDGVALLTSAPAGESDVNSYTKIDVEGDGNGTYNEWVYASTNDANYNSIATLMIYPNSSYGSQSSLDDWVFIPVSVTAAAADISVSLDVKSQYSYSSSDFSFEVKAGKSATVEGMTYNVIDASGFKSKAWTTYNGTFSSSGATTYYIGIHAKYPKSTAGKLWIGNINVSMTAKSGGSGETGGSGSGEGSGDNQNAQPGVIFSMHPTEEEFNNCTVIDDNNDSVTIQYGVMTDSQGNELDWPILYINKKTDLKADDWIITPAMTLPVADKAYEVAIDAYCTVFYKTEAFEIALGTSPDVASMTKIILDEPNMKNTSYQTFTGRFGIEQAGTYYVGIHIKSNKVDGWQVALRNLSVSLTDQSALVPGNATNISVVTDPKGALNATVSFTLPTDYINGGTIPADDTITATVATGVDSKEVSGKPGEQVSVNLTTENGTNGVTITTKNSNGEGTTVSRTFKSGLDEPVSPKVRYTTSDDNMTLNISWDRVSEGANGGIVDPDGVTYEVYQYITTDDDEYWELLQSNITDTSYSFTATETTQNLYEFLVLSVNSIGGSDGDYDCYASAVLGTPYTLPMEESFTNGSVTVAGLSIDYPSDDYYASWALDDPSLMADDCANESGYAIMSLNQYEGTGKARLSLPKFSTVGNKYVRAGLSVFLFSGMPDVDVYLLDNLGTTLKLGTINGDMGYGWKEVHFDIPEEYINKPNLNIMLDMAIDNTYTFFAMDNYRVYERSEYDYRMYALDYPSTVKLGEDATITAILESRGYAECDIPSLTAIIFDTTTAATIAIPKMTTTATGKLQEGDRVTYTGTFRFDNADYVGQTVGLAVGTTISDNDNTNNVAAVPFKVAIPAMPVIIDLNAKNASEGIQLSWTAPYAQGYKDNLEGYAAFDSGSQIGPWKNIDYDGNDTYSFGNIEVPNQGKSFQIINDFELGYDGALEMPSGNQCFIVFSAMEADSDDWLISPEVVGGSSVSFSVCGLSEDYTEQFEVLYSSTDDEADSFKSLETFELEDEEWLDFTVDLPADAKYFAFHYYSNDTFAMMLDDIIYQPANPECTINGYDIYRNNTLSTHISADDTTAAWLDTDTELTKNYTYNVATTGTYNGEAFTFPMSNTASCTFAGVNDIKVSKSITSAKGEIIVKGYSGSQVKVYNLLGMQVVDATATSDAYSISIAPGNYIVEVDKHKAKLFIK